MPDASNFRKVRFGTILLKNSFSVAERPRRKNSTS